MLKSTIRNVTLEKFQLKGKNSWQKNRDIVSSKDQGTFFFSTSARFAQKRCEISDILLALRSA